MGYTHYMRINNIDPEQFKKVVSDAKKLHEHLPANVVIAGWDGLDEPLFDDKVISFNGDRDANEDHETFRLSVDERGSSFCKTARKPYDLLVVAILFSVKEHLPDVLVSSDGGTEDHQEAAEFYEQVLNRKAVPL